MILQRLRQMGEAGRRPDPKELRVVMGSAIGAARRAAGWKQVRLSHALGYPNDSYLKGIENGKQWPPGREFLVKVEAVLASPPGSLTDVWDDLQGQLRGRSVDHAPNQAARSANGNLPPPAPQPGDGGHRRWVVAVGAAGLLAAIVGLLIAAAQRPPRSAAAGSAATTLEVLDASRPHILAPRDGAAVCYEQAFRGNAIGPPPGQVLWLVVKPLADPLTYPQAGPLAIESAMVQGGGRSWTGVAFLGTGPGSLGGEGATFRVSLVAAGADADAAMRAHREWLRTAPDAGLQSLPEGTIVLHSIVVTRTSC